MSPVERHPDPLGCFWCGLPERGHGQRWTPEARWHGYWRPTKKQVAVRMRTARGLEVTE